VPEKVFEYITYVVFIGITIFSLRLLAITWSNRFKEFNISTKEELKKLKEEINKIEDKIFKVKSEVLQLIQDLKVEKDKDHIKIQSEIYNKVHEMDSKNIDLHLKNETVFVRKDILEKDLEMLNQHLHFLELVVEELKTAISSKKI
jgi:hypothetical protein